MNRKILDIATIAIISVFFETHFFQFAGTDYPFYGLLKVAIAFQLIVPFMSVFVRIIDKLNNKAIQNTLFVNVDSNFLHVEENDVKVKADFSTHDRLIAYPELFEKALNDVLRLSLKHKGLLTTAPFVVLKLDLNLLSKIELAALVKICFSAGALDSIIVSKSASEADIGKSIKSFSLPNFA